MKTKYFTIYQITNLVNGMIYIGHHTTFNLEDDYMGSGRYITASIIEFGVENFKKEILFIFDNKDEMVKKEEELVNSEFRDRADTYNVALGGGGFGMSGVKLSKETCEKMSKSRTGKKRIFSERHKLRLREACKKRKPQTPEMIEKRIAPLRGRKKPPLSDDLKLKISISRRLHPTVFTAELREKLSLTFKGRIWISNIELQKTKMVKSENLNDYLDTGWILGRIRFVLLNRIKNNASS